MLCLIFLQVAEVGSKKQSSDDHVLQRKKRMTQVEKNTCQLFIQTDHLFYKYYKTREAVIAQVITGKVQDIVRIMHIDVLDVKYGF